MPAPEGTTMWQNQTHVCEETRVIWNLTEAAAALILLGFSSPWLMPDNSLSAMLLQPLSW